MESSLSAGRTRRTSSLGRLSDHASKENGTRNNTDEFHDRPPVPTLLGYEVMEERAKFTVYKILVRRAPDESWVVFRRYTDFSRLNNKLKEMFPKFKLSLPPKRRFKDNYDMNFLEERQVGLQAFLQNLVAQKDMTESDVVRGFLCLDDPPGPFDSLEESKAYCETLEETNYRLQRELQDKQREIETLRRILEDRELQIGQLEKTKKDHQSRSCDSSRDRRTGRPGQQFHAPFGKEKPRSMLELLRFRRPRTCELPQINMSSGPGLEIPLSVFKENSCKESTDLNT